MDSIKAETAIKLKGIRAYLGNSPGTRVEQVDVADSGEYVNIVVRVHVARKDIYGPVTVSPVMRMSVGDMVAGSMRTAAVPDAPPLVIKVDMISAVLPVPVLRIGTGDNTASARPAVVPHLPPLVIEPDTISALPLHAVHRLDTDVAVAKRDAAGVPPLPPVVIEIWEPVPLLAGIKLPLKITTPPKPDTLDMSIFEEKRYPVDEMHLSDQGYSLLEKLEGFSPELYNLRDGGFTIGFGFFIPYTEGARWEKGLTWEDAERLIREKVPEYEDQVKKYINVPLTQNEFDALTMLAYNLGGFSRATSIVNDINEQADLDKLKSDWNRFVHSKAPGVMRGLIRRRNDEMGVRIYSNYQPERKIQILKIRK